ncbi:MAG: type II toxin-antitoxin system VapC family toxin [Terriglobia bacterium]
MRTVFADSLYWIAIARPRDPWSTAARQAKVELGDVRIITTDEVLAEFLTALSAGGPKLRQQAASIVRQIILNPMVKVIPQSRDSFLEGLKFYELRGDKEYSLTDCVSMNAMRSESVAEILTNDHHFRQEGFTVLMNRQD